MSRRVMNLGYLLTQNARRHGDRTGFVWGERSWTWREIDAAASRSPRRSARAASAGATVFWRIRRICEEMFFSMFATFRLGAVWSRPISLMPDEVAYLATASGAKGVSVPRRISRPRQGCCGTILHLADRRGGRVRRAFARRSIKAHAGVTVDNVAAEHDDPCWFFFTSGTTGRSKAAVLTHGQNGLRHHQPSRGSDPPVPRKWTLRWCRAAVARRRRASVDADRARREDGAAADRKIRHRRGVPAD